MAARSIESATAWRNRESSTAGRPRSKTSASSSAGDETQVRVFEVRLAPGLRALRDALADGIVSGRGHARARTAAALDLALDFGAWQTLRSSGLGNDQAVELMVRAVRCAGA